MLKPVVKNSPNGCFIIVEFKLNFYKIEIEVKKTYIFSKI